MGTAIEAGALAALAAGLRGKLLLPEDAEYEQARHIWNATVDRRPAAILRAAGVADVRRGVTFSRDEGLPLAVRGGGHNIAGNAVCDDGLVIDLSGMRSVMIDPKKRRAHVAGGALLGDVDHEAQAFGLATPLGINSTTGVAGLTLGGGFGWLTRAYGMTVDNLVAADVVTADGQLLLANVEDHADLFWALRGGGGNFGVVTRFELQLHPVGPEVFAGLVVFPFGQAVQVLSGYRDLAPTLSEQTALWALLRKAPPLPFLPPEVHGREIVAMPVFSFGPTSEDQRLLDRVRRLGTPLGEHVGRQPYVAWQRAFDGLLTPGARNYWKSHNLDRLSDGLVRSLVQFAGQLPSPHCEIFIGQLGGRANRVAPSATAYVHRSHSYVMNVHTRWEEPSADAACKGWAREFFQATAPQATGGVYVNFMPDDETGRIAQAYGANYERLAQVKRTYDPTNLFRLNQNIPPTR